MSVSIALVRGVVAAVERQGVERAQLLAGSGLDPERLRDQNGQLTLPEYDRLLRVAMTLSGDEALGLHIVQHMPGAAFDVLGHLTEHAATLRQAIETLVRYAKLVTFGPRPELVEERDTASIRFAFHDRTSHRTRFAAELSVTGYLRMIRAFVGSDAPPRGAYFTYPAPTYRAEYTRIFAGTECFDHAFNGIAFDRTWLDRTQLYKSPELYTVLEQQAVRELDRLERDTALVRRVTEHLVAHGPRALPSMDQVARAFGMSARSLRRRLHAEGVVYKDLVERVLMDAAKRMLEDPRMSIQEAAHATGFATSAAFHRAFKRWTGVTPKTYRASF